MSQDELPRNMALRIGLAARELSGFGPADLLEVLGDTVGLPPSEKKLAGLSIDKLRSGADGKFFAIDRDILKKALSTLKGHDGADEADTPEAEAYADGDMPGSIRVAVASNGGEDLDGHFGTCKRFLVYQVSPDEVRLIDVRSTLDDMDAEDKNKFRAELISDCQVLFVVSIGGPAAAKVVRADIHPIKKPQGGAAREILAEVSGVIAVNPPPWLAKAMGREAEERVRFRESS
ncbi:MAG: dinitrogenase iron-molybdenum cofactor biosynthesis protein [Alphaproteobacteria bacterium]|nr:dinitrogenase iron-molybdenum cofactor biosynthesis protein [Alphaproteobacteria bacterium]MBF0249393.1 dinitrogenase iron-molybdenum cofactor biosynthesis protein [Alphaproteobacteria bacterium]